MSLLTKNHSENQLGDVLAVQFPKREFAVMTDCLCDPDLAPPGGTVYTFGDRRRGIRQEILLVIPLSYLSDRPQQTYVTGSLAGNPLVNCRETLDHRTEFLDPTSMDYVPADHHSRMVSTQHARALLQMTSLWKENYGWVGLAERVLQMAGMTNQEHLPYRDWAMREITEHEYMHLVMMNFVGKCNLVKIAWIQTMDPNLVCVHVSPLQSWTNTHFAPTIR